MKPFSIFAQHEKLTANLIEFVMTSIAMVDRRTTDCVTGLEATQKFLTSIGRFGNTPFLWSMYGSGELPQVEYLPYRAQQNAAAVIYDRDETCIDSSSIHSSRKLVETKVLAAE